MIIFTIIFALSEAKIHILFGNGVKNTAGLVPVAPSFAVDPGAERLAPFLRMVFGDNDVALSPKRIHCQCV
jgi:hypothetical protein